MSQLISLFANKTFQVFVMVLVAITAFTVLMVTNTITVHDGLTPLELIIGFGIGVPVSTGSNQTAP